MNILSLEKINKNYTETPLFNEASFFLQEGEKVGIIGINGMGKSTLLRIIAGIEEPDSGKVTRANNIVVRCLWQNPVFEENETIIESILNYNANSNQGHWDVESNAKTMLTKLGINDYNQRIEELSGGQKKRVALVAALAVPADVLILDEPTNHLDNEMADWLEDYLKKWKGALIMVTHDRYFLDSVSNRIVEVDNGNIYSYQTNYSGYLQLKLEREEMEQSSAKKRSNILRNELEWIRRGAKARSTKQKARIQRYEELKSIKGPVERAQIDIGSVASRLGRTTVEIDNISKSYGEKILFKDFSYIFLKDDRIGFIGKNGCGKTTLMKIIAGIIQADSGSIIVGQTVKLGYYTQEIVTDKNAGIAYMDPEKRVIDYIRDTAEFVQTEDGSVSASVMLDRFLFPPQKQYSLIGKLSGGEKRRLNLLRVLMEAPNVLILDEPTNDLDIQTLTILEDYLDRFKGIVITVSHDRYFLDRIVKRMFSFEGNGIIRQYEGGYTDYALVKEIELEEIERQQQSNTKSAADTKVSDSKSTWKSEKKLKFTYMEQKEYETIEAEVAGLEEQIEMCDKEMATCSSDFIKLNELNEKKEQLEQKLADKMDRWMYLEELAAKIAEEAKA